MNEYNEGDLVRVKKGEFLIEQRFARSSNSKLYLPDFAGRPDPEWLFANGYTITIIEKAKPTPPAGYGLWRLSNGMVVQHDPMGWRSPNLMNYVHDYVYQSASFTLLEERAVTAKAVLDHIRTYAWADGFTAHLEATAKKFGVTND